MVRADAEEISPDLAPEAARFKNEVHLRAPPGRFEGLGAYEAEADPANQ
jgi:hypothetical protein